MTAISDIDASRTFVRTLFVAACDMENEPPDEQECHTLRHCRCESEDVPLPNLAGPSPVNYTATSQQAEFENDGKDGLLFHLSISVRH